METRILKKARADESYYSRLESLLGEDQNAVLEKKFFDTSKFKSPQPYSGERTYEIIKSKVSFNDVIKTANLKREITSLVDEYKHKNVLESYNMHCDNKILFFGPSGCGKTLTAMALANVLNKKLYLVNLSTIVSSSLGKTSNNIFQIAEDAKMNQAIIFFDEFDALAKMRSDENDHGEMKRVVSALIQIMDFLDENTIFIAATNHIDLIDSALLRRFSKKIAFELPTKKNIEAYLSKVVAPTKIKLSKKIASQLAKEFEGLPYGEVRDQFLIKLKRYLIQKIKKGAANKISTIDTTILV